METSWIAVIASSAAVVAALATAVSIWFVRQQVQEMKHQTDLQRLIAEGSVAPYIWADIRLQSRNGWNLELVIGNSGPTVATNVRISIDPPLPSDYEGGYVLAMHRRLSEGLSSLGPGRTLHWTLGPSADLVNRPEPLAHTIRIDCDGPNGPVSTSEYVIDMADFRESVAHHDGGLIDIAKAIESLRGALPDQRKPFRVGLEEEIS